MTSEEQTVNNDILHVVVNVKEIQKPIELTISKSNTVNDVFNTLEILSQVHHITSYNLYYKSKLLDSEIVLEELLSNDQQKTISIDLKHKLYDEKSINEHLIKTRDIVGLTEVESFGLNSGISKIGELELEPIPEQAVPEATEDDGEKTKPTPVVPSDEEKAKVSEVLASFFTPISQSFYSPSSVTTPTVRGLFLSAWNPVPFNFKSRGHLVYVALQTLEGETFHITGSTTGFFVNKSSSSKFDPTAREPSYASFNLYDLIAKVSKNFKNQIKANNEKLNKVDPITFLKPQTTFLSNPWLTKTPHQEADFGRVQFTESSGIRDLNDEYQNIRELPAVALQDRIIRERLLARATYDFTVNATKGAIAILNHAVTPLNSAEEERLHIFLKDGIFYSFGIDAAGAFSDKGGDEAARASTNQDLRAIRFFNLVDSKGIYTLLTTIVDYAGKRVVCQTPVPGLFTASEPKEVKNEETGEVEIVEGEPLTKIDYGRDDDAGVVKSDESFVKGLEPYRKALHYKKQKVDGNEIVTSPDFKGMIGTDKRKYILDLYNATPYDVDFIANNYDPSSETSYPHRQTVIRSEAIQHWYGSKLKTLLTEEAKKQGIDLDAPLKEGDSLPEIKVDEESLYFDVQSSSNDANVVDLSKFITSTLIPQFIKIFDGTVNLTPSDGNNLTSTLHKQGINIRYLGTIVKSLDKLIAESSAKEAEELEKYQEINTKYEAKLKAKIEKAEAEYKLRIEAEKKGEKYEPKEEEKEEEEELLDEEHMFTKSKIYKSLRSIIIQEAIARASKHILRKYSNGLPTELVPSLVSHFHNVLLGSKYNSQAEVSIEDSGFYSHVDLSFTKLTTELVKEKIVKEVQIRYRFDLPSSWFEDIVETQLLKAIALKFGIQWEQRDYHFTKESEEAFKLANQDKKSKKQRSKSPTPVERTTVFEPVDVTLVPIIKDAITRASTGEQFFETGHQALSSENEDQRAEGYNLLTESVSVYEQTYGLIHPEVQRLYSSLSSIYQEAGSKAEATLMARKSLAISERVFGLDSHEAIISGLNLAFLEFSSGSTVNSLKLYSRLFQISSKVLNDQLLNIGNIAFNIIIQLQERGFVNEAISIIPKLIEATAKVSGEDSFIVGHLQFRYSYLLAISERLTESLREADSALPKLTKYGSYNNPITRQARDLRDQVASFKVYEETKAKYDKERLKLENEAAAKKSKEEKLNSKKNGPDLTNKSIDEVLSFVLGNSKGSGKKKSKKSKK